MILQIQKALARLQPLHESKLSTRARKGQIQVVSVTYDKTGKSTVVEVSSWMSINDLINQ
jgi:hypothetical protein